MKIPDYIQKHLEAVNYLSHIFVSGPGASMPETKFLVVRDERGYLEVVNVPEDAIPDKTYGMIVSRKAVDDILRED